MNTNDIIIRVATPEDKHYAEAITTEMAESAKARGTGIAQRTPEYVQKKMDEGKAVIAVTKEGTWVGFCYIEAWEHEKYVANSGLIVSPPFRKDGVATNIKKKTFELSRKKFPDAKIFGLTTGLAVMKINSELGYEPVTYSELTRDEEFWKGCRSCVNFEILMSKNRSNCLCTAMMYKGSEKEMPKLEGAISMRSPVRRRKKRKFANNFRLFERWIRFKRHVLLNERKRKNNGDASEKKSILSFLYFW